MSFQLSRENRNKDCLHLIITAPHMTLNPRIQADGSACHAAGVTRDKKESKPRNWPAARQAAPQLMPTVGRIETDRMKNKLAIIGGILVAILFLSCASNRGGSITEKNKELVLTMNHEVWNKGNLAVIEALYSENFVQHFLPDGSEIQGIEPLREHVKEHREAFPDWREEINHIVAEKDLVVIQFTSSGTNLGSWLGNSPTGKKVLINEFAILRIENGKIAEQWLMPDIYNLRKQLGLDDR